MSPEAVTEADVKVLVRSAALLVVPLETALREIEPTITLGQLAALEIIVNDGGVRPFILGDRMGISRQLAWQICRRLEVLGLATMTPQEGQKRAVIVAPTDTGMMHLKAVSVIHKRIASHMSKTLQADDVPRTKVALEALAAGAVSLHRIDPILTALPPIGHNPDFDALGPFETQEPAIGQALIQVPLGELSIERFVLTDAQWAKMAPHCPSKSSGLRWSGRNNRLFVEAVLWVARTGRPWRDLPALFGRWNTVFKRYRNWVRRYR